VGRVLQRDRYFESVRRIERLQKSYLSILRHFEIDKADICTERRILKIFHFL
jgi:hypothetical protein